MPNGTVPKKWHLKLYEKVHILTGYCKHLKEYTKLISKEFVNFKCLKKIKTKFWENRHIMKKVQFLGIICWYICDLQKISILFKILLEMAYLLNFFPYRKGALWARGVTEPGSHARGIKETKTGNISVQDN